MQIRYYFKQKNIAILCLLLLQLSLNAFAYSDTEEENEYCKDDLEAVLSFMPGQKKCLEYTSNFSNDTLKYNYFNSLKEFKINKNGKYCLWGSKNWDDECQDASMKYAYGDYGREEDAEKFKQIVSNFIKYIQNQEYDKALALTHQQAVFFTHDDYDVPVINQSFLSQKLFGYRAYIHPYHGQKTIHQNPEQERQFGDFDIEVFRKHLMHIDTNNLKFFLADITKNRTYDLVILYQEQNINKYFVISFDFGRGRLGETVYSQKLYDLAIYSALPD